MESVRFSGPSCMRLPLLATPRALSLSSYLISGTVPPGEASSAGDLAVVVSTGTTVSAPADGWAVPATAAAAPDGPPLRGAPIV